MADQMFVTVKLGGKVSRELIPTLLDTFEVFYEGTDIPDSIGEMEENVGEIIEFSGWCNNYEDLVEFCRDQDMSCTISVSGNEENDPCSEAVIKGMKRYYNTDSEGSPMSYNDAVLPYVNLMIDYMKMGKDAYALYTGDDKCGAFVKELLQNPDDFIKMMEDKIKEDILPLIPEIPPFEIFDEE